MSTQSRFGGFLGVYFLGVIFFCFLFILGFFKIHFIVVICSEGLKSNRFYYPWKGVRISLPPPPPEPPPSLHMWRQNVWYVIIDFNIYLILLGLVVYHEKFTRYKHFINIYKNKFLNSVSETPDYTYTIIRIFWNRWHSNKCFPFT